MVKKIPLTQGKFAIVDDCDFHWLSQIKWQFQKSGYAIGVLFGRRKTLKKVYMHRLILLAPDTVEVDHKNHNGLDNRRKNLRTATRKQQNANKRKFSGTSIYKGVNLRRDKLKWCAQIKSNGKAKYLGSFDTEEEAARVYNEYAAEEFGEFAHLNDLSEK